MLADEGEEGGVVSKGLGLISGKVSRLPDGPKQPVPHVGWNNVEFRRPHPVTEGLKSEVDFYFVHSYALQCADKRDMLGATNYGLEFCSIAARDQVVGFQFHPEKSQVNGLKLLENFCRWNP